MKYIVKAGTPCIAFGQQQLGLMLNIDPSGELRTDNEVIYTDKDIVRVDANSYIFTFPIYQLRWHGTLIEVDCLGVARENVIIAYDPPKILV